MKKRIISCLLALVISISCIPTVSAAAAIEPKPNGTVLFDFTNVGKGKYDGSGENWGKASFAWTTSPNVLTIKDGTDINWSALSRAGGASYAIIKVPVDTTIVVEGTAFVKLKPGGMRKGKPYTKQTTLNGIMAGKNLTFSGTGKLSVDVSKVGDCSEKPAVPYNSNAIFGDDAISFTGGTVYAKSGNCKFESSGILAFLGDTTVSGDANVTGVAGKSGRSRGIYIRGGALNITGGKMLGIGGDASFKSGAAASIGISTYRFSTLSGGEVTGIAGTATSSDDAKAYGIDLYSGGKLCGTTVTGIAGKATASHACSMGITSSNTLYHTAGFVTGIGDSSSTGYNYGVYVDSANLHLSGTDTVLSGTGGFLGIDIQGGGGLVVSTEDKLHAYGKSEYDSSFKGLSAVKDERKTRQLTLNERNTAQIPESLKNVEITKADAPTKAVKPQ